MTLAHDPFVCTYNPWSNALMWRKSTSLRVLQPVYESIQRFNTSYLCQQHDAYADTPLRDRFPSTARNCPSRLQRHNCRVTDSATPEFGERRTPDIMRQQPLAPLQAPLLLLLLIMVMLRSRTCSPAARAVSPPQARPPVQVQSTCTGNIARSATPSWPANS